MKKFFFIILVLFQITSSYANIQLSKGNTYEGKFRWKGTNFYFPEGEWTFFDKYHFAINSIELNCIDFIQTENNTWKALFEVCDIVTGGKFANYIGAYFNNLLKNGKYDNCTLRREYQYANLWSRGMSYNCLKTRHLDIYKELNYPDDPESLRGYILNYILDHNLKLPKTALASSHIISLASVRDKAVEINYAINPELFGAPISLQGDEEKSEYHRDNIAGFPKKKKFMEEFTKDRAVYHKHFEIEMKAKNHHKLDLTEFGINIKDDKIINNKKNKNDDFIKQLKDLNDLYKSGVLTKEEFESAKKMLLN